MNKKGLCVILPRRNTLDNAVSFMSLLSFLNPGRFGPIPVRSGRFGPISGLSRFGPTGVGRFGPISKVGRFGPILGVSRFGLIYLFWENRKDIRLCSS